MYLKTEIRNVSENRNQKYLKTELMKYQKYLKTELIQISAGGNTIFLQNTIG